MSAIAASAWDALVRAYRSIERDAGRQLDGTAGLTLSSCAVIAELLAAEAPPTISNIARQVLLDRSQVSRIVTELEQLGLVSRGAGPGDQRERQLALTALGMKRSKAVIGEYHAAVARAFNERAATGELASLIQALKDVSSAS